MNNEKVLVSVIVTVYNVAPYIERCLESIISQTYEHIEIIVIDDGSTDGSDLLCDNFIKRDKRVIIIHKDNMGVISARQQGAEMANGSLITFVDGDDWIEPDMYENLVSVCLREKPDMITSGLIWDWKDRQEILLDSVSEGVYEKRAIKESIFPKLTYDKKTKKQGITASVCNKLFNRNMLIETLKLIDKRLTLGEDGAIVYCFIGQADKIVVIHKSWYHYEQHEKSANRTFGLNAFEKLYRLKKCILDNLKALKIDTEYQIDIYIKDFLYPAIEDVYKIKLGSVSYIFPYEWIPKNSKIILYGAGEVGQSYWKCIQYGEYSEVVAWVDQNYIKLQKSGLAVESLESALSKDFDYIVIAISKKEIVESIRSNLLKRNIEAGKIIWKKSEKIV